MTVLLFVLLRCMWLQNEMLEMVTTAIVCLSSTQPSMLDNVPQLGYMQKVFQVMTADNDALPMAAMQLAYQFSTNEVCCYKIILPFFRFMLFFPAM